MAEDDGITEMLKTMMDRTSVIYGNESEENFRGRISSTLIGLIAAAQHLDEEVKALKAAQKRGPDPGLY